MKSKKKKRGPSGMVKRSLGKKGAGPAKPPPDIGAVVWYIDPKKEAWRTGKLLRVIDRGQHYGKLEVRDSVSGHKRKVTCENVRSL